MEINNFLKGLNNPKTEKITKEEFENTIIGFVTSAYIKAITDFKQAILKEMPKQEDKGGFIGTSTEYNRGLRACRAALDRAEEKLLKKDV